jgi:hypothetical protein
MDRCGAVIASGVHCNREANHGGPHHADLHKDPPKRGPRVKSIDWPNRERAVDERREVRGS